MSAARISSDGRVTQLDARAGAREVLTEDDVKDAAKLTRLLVRMLADVAGLLRRSTPSRIDFEDYAVGASGAVVTLQHNLRGRVRWWVVGWQSTGTASPILREGIDANSVPLTDANTLVLQSYVAGTATIRVESAG